MTQKKYRISPVLIYISCASQYYNGNNFFAWSYIIIRNDKIHTAKHNIVFETNINRALMRGTIDALNFVSERKYDDERIILFINNKYITNCWDKHWWRKWQQNYWMTSYNTPVINQDLWEQLIPYFSNFDYLFENPLSDLQKIYISKCTTSANSELTNFLHNWRNLSYDEQAKLRSGISTL